MKKTYTLYISTCGFNFQIKFLNSFKSRTRDIYVNTFISKYANFLLKTEPSPLDCIISFKEPPKESSYFLKIGRQKLTSIYETSLPNNAYIYYHISDYQIDLIIVDVIKRLLIEKKDFILHASTILINDRAFLFTGRSGIGKTTMATFLKPMYKCIGDDLICIRKKATKYIAYSLPLRTKVRKLNLTAKGYEIKSIFSLKQTRKCTIIKENNKSQILSKFLSQIILHETHKKTIISNILCLSSRVDYYQFNFSLNKEEVCRVFRNFLSTQQHKQLN